MTPSFRKNYQEAFVIPGISPFKAKSLKHNRHKSNRR